MMNHLRIALKNILKSNLEEYRAGNYYVKTEFTGEDRSYHIYHLKFMGHVEFDCCFWYPTEKRLIITDSSVCPNEEIIFITRTIQRIGYSVDLIQDSLDIINNYKA
jgi:hypothetical protein